MNRRTIKAHRSSPWRYSGGFWTAPLVMATEDVLCGSAGCLFWPGEVLEAMARDWHNVPACLDHPTVDGEFCSINHSQEVYDSYCIGTIIEPVYDRRTRSLRAKIQIPAGHPLLPEVMRATEVSMGVFSGEKSEAGDWRGKLYEARVVSATPDHCAILSQGQIGACDWEAGCGIRAHNQRQRMDPVSRELSRALIAHVDKTMKGATDMKDEKMQGYQMVPGVTDHTPQPQGTAAEQLQALKSEWAGAWPVPDAVRQEMTRLQNLVDRGRGNEKPTHIGKGPTRQSGGIDDGYSMIPGLED